MSSSSLGSRFDLKDVLSEPNGIEVYKNDIVVKRCLKYGNGQGRGTGDRKKNKVTKFSPKSLKEMMFVASNTSIDFYIMITVTYPAIFPENGKDVKYHLKKLLQCIRRRFAASYFWFLEFQGRGAPHFHILLSNEWYRPSDIDWLKETWNKIIENDSEHTESGTRIEKLESVEGGKRYPVKYGAIMKQKKIPTQYTDVGRFWGHSRDVKPVKIMDIQCLNEDDMLAMIDDSWGYKKNVRGKIIKTLFNASNHVRQADDFR